MARTQTKKTLWRRHPTAPQKVILPPTPVEPGKPSEATDEQRRAEAELVDRSRRGDQKALDFGRTLSAARIFAGVWATERPRRSARHLARGF